MNTDNADQQKTIGGIRAEAEGLNLLFASCLNGLNQCYPRASAEKKLLFSELSANSDTPALRIL
jgi:hypothetical protein